MRPMVNDRSLTSPQRESKFLPGYVERAVRDPYGCGMPDRVTIREVGPRDGFQNEPERIATADKIRLINALARTGLRRIEVASFVRPDVIPQLNDAIDVLHGIDVPDGVELTVLVPNERGLRTALEHRDRFHEIAVFLS